jgi:hypothetical protein
VQTLPSFDDVLGQHDAEMLLSYMTVPYLRIPLILGFFASDDRIHALKSDAVRKMLEAVVLESVPTFALCSSLLLLPRALASCSCLMLLPLVFASCFTCGCACACACA